jgi:hypothetical protein
MQIFPLTSISKEITSCSIIYGLMFLYLKIFVFLTTGCRSITTLQNTWKCQKTRKIQTLKSQVLTDTTRFTLVHIRRFSEDLATSVLRVAQEDDTTLLTRLISFSLCLFAYITCLSFDFFIYFLIYFVRSFCIIHSDISCISYCLPLPCLFIRIYYFH